MRRGVSPLRLQRLPPSLLDADRALCALHRRVVTSRYLNPTNEPELRAAFAAGKPVRPAYTPASWADEHLRALDRVRPPLSHPLGAVVAQAVHESRLATVALRDRTAAAFAALGEASGWDEPPGAPVPGPFPPRPEESVRVGAPVLAEHLARALRGRGLHRWRVEMDPVMTARVLVDAPRSVVRVNPRATCAPAELHALEAHEIGVHVARAEAGARQPLGIFALGLPGALATEEGLALHAEAEAAGLPAAAVSRLEAMARLALRAQGLGLTALVRAFAPELGAGTALGMALRVKRGLAHPEQPGAYTKDRVYWLGLCRVGHYLAEGGRRDLLAVGKVGTHHPVAAWVERGWLSLPG